MTTPQSLTEEQIELLRKIPPVGAVGYVPESTLEWQRLNREFHGLFMHEGDRFWRLHQADVLLATLQAERERERERVNGLAALLADHTQDLILSSPGQETPLWRAYGLPDYEDGVTGTTPIEAMENLAANLSPDVLGDQKDKGKAALTAPERDKATAGSEPSAADIAVARKKYLQLGREIQSGAHNDDLRHSHSKLGIFLGEAFGEKVWRGEA